MNPQDAAQAARKRAAITAAVTLFLQSPETLEDPTPEPGPAIAETGKVESMPRTHHPLPLSSWKNMTWQRMRDGLSGYTVTARGAWRTR